MIEREDIVAAILDAAGGELVGRVRLQKTAYLLDQLGFSSDFRYEYHHYGPYSRDLDNALADAKAFGVATEEIRHRHGDGVRYSVFRLTSDTKPKPEAYGRLDPARAKELVRLFAETNVTVLELAATAHWLWWHEGRSDWRHEITKRKGVKVQDGRLEKALALLNQLGLAPTLSFAA